MAWHMWQSHASPRGCLRGADMWRTTDTWQSHASPRGRLCGAYMVSTVFGLASDEPTGIVGLGKFIGAVTQRLKSLSRFICAFSAYFFRVGLCSRGFLNFR